MNNVFILVSGKAGVGKTTLSKLLVDIITNSGNFTTILPIATGVKKCATDYFNWDGNKDSNGRKLLQGIGVIGRAYDPDTWIKYLLDTVPTWIDKDDVIICDDWRFENEALYLEKYSYKVFRIRVNAPSRESLKNTPEYNDISETSLPNEANPIFYDAFIDNEGSLEELGFVAQALSTEILNQFLTEEV